MCGRADMLRNIGVIVDEGTTTTHGTSRTVTTGYGVTNGMLSDGTSFSGSGPMTSVGASSQHSVSTSRLADRFRMPARPRTRFGSWFLLGWLAPALLLGVLTGPGFAPEAETADLPAAWVITISIAVTFVFALAVTWIVGLIVAFVQRAATATSLRARRAQWNAGYWRLRGAFFCSRDGVATDGVVAQSPEEFVRFVFGG